jgi:hypothetical protein
MPPWKPDHEYGEPFLASRGLTEREIDIIQQWAAGGASQGDPRDLPTPPDWNDGWRLGAPDLVIRMPEPFDVPAGGPDVFRTFVFPIPTDAARYVSAIEFMPGTRAVHHANMRLDDTPLSRELDAKDPARLAMPARDGADALVPPKMSHPLSP